MVADTMTTTMTTTSENTGKVSHEEPILSRLDRLDIMLHQLEEIKGCRKSSLSHYSAKSSCESTPSSGTLTSEDLFSPKSQLEKHCRPIESVVMETDAKGKLIERLDHVEERVLKLCMQLEDMLEAAQRNRDHRGHDHEEVKMVEEEMKVVEGKTTKTTTSPKKKKKKKKGFKQLVKQCVTGRTN